MYDVVIELADASISIALRSVTTPPRLRVTSAARTRRRFYLAPRVAGEGSEELERTVLQNLIRVGWGRDNPAFRQVFGALFLPEGTAEQHQWFNDLAKTMPMENALRVRQVTDVIDVRREAAEVRAPTLVLHARGDGMIPFEYGRQLAALIPGAGFVPLDSRNHVLLETEPAWARFEDDVRAFLGAGKRPRGHPRRRKSEAHDD